MISGVADAEFKLALLVVALMVALPELPRLEIELDVGKEPALVLVVFIGLAVAMWVLF